MRAVQGHVDLLCFGEAFLQGFDALHWDYTHDKETAVSSNSEIIRQLADWTVNYKVDLLLGYFERANNRIFSSCAVISGGQLLHNYRRISKGWKEYRFTDYHYQEGDTVQPFLYKGYKIQLALCGDLWDLPERFCTDGVLLWPIYVSFSRREWETAEWEYAQRAQLTARETLMVNSMSEEPKSCGGAFFFRDGDTVKKLPFGHEGILVVEFESKKEPML